MARSKNLLLLILLLCIAPLFGQRYPDSQVHNLITSGVDKIINEEYEAAEADFKELDRRYPLLPLGKIFLAAVENARSYDYAVPADENKIYRLLDAAVARAKELVAANAKDVWAHYMLGLAKGYKSYYSAVQESWLSAFNQGLSSISDFEKCLEIDPNFYESYVAIGSYKYWKSEKTAFLNWLPFFNDERELGIGLLKKSISNPSYNAHVAINSLVWIYINKKEFSRAQELARSALNKYPNSRFFKWSLARVLEESDRSAAIAVYYTILRSYKPSLVKNRVNEIVLRHIIAQNYARLGNRQKALEECDRLLAMKNFSTYEQEKTASRLQRVAELKASLQR